VTGVNPIDLLFGGMEKLGPGGNAHTLNVLRLLPKQRFGVVVDAGCGTGAPDAGACEGARHEDPRG
jgi:hypothetical protein